MALSRPMRYVSLLALLLLLAPGCRSNRQAQLVERELRWQENQIYALEDYLMEYQAKVRRLREENASLARALEECESACSSAPRSTNRQQSTNREAPEELPALKFDLPDGRDGTPSAPPTEPQQPDGEEVDIPPVPLPEMPAEQEEPLPTSWIGPPPLKVVAVDLPWIAPQDDEHDAPAKSNVAESEDTAPVAIATYEEPLRPWISGGLPDEPAESTVPPLEQLAEESPTEDTADGPPTEDTADELQAENPTDDPQRALAEADATGAEIEPLVAVEEPDNEVLLEEPLPLQLVGAGPTNQVAWVLLQAELARDPDSAGQLLELRVLPMAADDQPTRFAGEVSVMLRDPTLSGPEGRLARWDFAADAVSAAWDVAGPNDALSLSLPLEEPLPADKPIALWVRLSPADEAQEKVLDHLTLRVESRRRNQTPNDLEGGKWAVARPGEPALLDGQRPRVTSAWRTAESVPPPITR